MVPPGQRPPDCVAWVARTHWLVGGTILVSVLLVYATVSRLPVELGPRLFIVSAGIAATYGLTGTLVWFGHPLGRILSYPCSLLYLPRQQLGLHIFRVMGSAEFRAHFTRRP